MASDQLRAALRWREYRSRVGSRLEGSPWGSDIFDSCEDCSLAKRPLRRTCSYARGSEGYGDGAERFRCVPSGTNVVRGRDMRASAELPIARRKTIFHRSIEP